MSESAYAGNLQVSEGRWSRAQAAAVGVIRVVDTLSIAAAYLAAICLVVLTLLMLAQISVGIVSKIVPTVRGDIPIVWEYGSYLMGATFMLGSAMTLRAGRHIRLGLLTDNVSPAIRRALDLFVSLLGLGLVGFLTYSLGRATIMAMISGSTSIASRTPLWIPLSVFAVGSLFLALQLMVRLLAALSGHAVEDETLHVGSDEE
jgi:TRAP-type C4-dicarboxylate transport system permease small subunit